MTRSTRTIKRVAIIAHPKLSDAPLEATRIAEFLNQHGLQTTYGFLNDESIHQRVGEGEFDLLIAVGGDGTMLRAGHLCAPADVPILGVNLGRFGFLMEIRKQQWQAYMPRLLQGDYWLEKRMMLCAELWHENNLGGSWDVLNEVVVSRGQYIRPVNLNAFVDGRFLTTYVADALIAATPTGSTAYALAAGGPILPPELRNILLVPVAPHLSIERAIVLEEGSSVSITVETDHQAVVSADGQLPVGMTNADRVDVRAGKHTVHFVRFNDPGYFYRHLTPHMNQNPATRSSRMKGIINE